jgi:hypothetical protein
MSTVASRLGAYAAAQQGRAFDWQAANCCHFAARWMHEETGVDPMSMLPLTDSALAAHRLIRSLGGSLVEAWTGQLGRPPIAPQFAQTGDVVRIALPAPDDEAIGICAGSTAMFVSRDGELVHVRMAHATHTWRLRP